MRSLGSALGVMLVGTSATLAQPVFQCVADVAAGIAWDGTSWQPATLDPSTNQYTVEPLDQEVVFLRGREYTYRVFPNHQPAADLLCEYVPPFRDIGPRLYCGDVMSGFLFDLTTARYTVIHTLGFINGDELGIAYTPHIEIGTCMRADASP